ncbi:hypothetical protein B0H13DRAFT_1936255 [Mycena leptocephala]|nr:hypothetical protein B0H13DRAFT_1936255 [Mycena leptocephala]
MASATTELGLPFSGSFNRLAATMLDKNGTFVMGAALPFMPPVLLKNLSVGEHSSISAIEPSVIVSPLLGRRYVCRRKIQLLHLLEELSSATFNLFHQGEGGGKPHTTAWPSKELAPGGETCFAWDTTAGKSPKTPPAVTSTTASQVVSVPTPLPASGAFNLPATPPPVVAQRQSISTRLGSTRMAQPVWWRRWPPFWIDAGKAWTESYSFIIPAGSRPGNLKITVKDHPLDGPYYSVMVIIEDSD